MLDTVFINNKELNKGKTQKGTDWFYIETAFSNEDCLSEADLIIHLMLSNKAF